jgi:hypothetical protein
VTAADEAADEGKGNEHGSGQWFHATATPAVAGSASRAAAVGDRVVLLVRLRSPS